MRGFCHGIASFLLPAHADRTRMAVRHAPLGVAERLRRRVPDNPGPVWPKYPNALLYHRLPTRHESRRLLNFIT